MLTLENAVLDNDGFRVTASFSVEEGERIAIIGPSGAGKSTLLAGLSGFLPLQSGRMLWNGEDISSVGPSERPVSTVFQDNNLFPHLTAFQNVGLGIRASTRLNTNETDIVMNALNRVGLRGLEDRKPGQLSGGQQSRVVLARVLVRDKPILLLDEPFAALGPALKVEMIELVTQLSQAEGTTVLMVTHDPADARRFADRTIVVSDGVARPPEPTGPLLAAPPEDLRIYLGQ